MGAIHEYTTGNPQGTDSERKWHSVLLDDPFHAGSRTLQSGGFLAFEAEKQRGGLPGLNLPHVHEYVARWIASGFTPELHWAASAGLKAALGHARELCRNFEGLDRLEQRLELLGIKAKNPQPGQRCLRVTGRTRTLAEATWKNGRGLSTSCSWCPRPGPASRGCCASNARPWPCPSTSEGTTPARFPVAFRRK
ncbi:hypothetical protein [Glutamicibacter mishrai]|uniref:hypothetical protein n=1 Tax=Glutamicibacter mishrai TaxID=1775880 RepID=UPI0015583D4B|nr:hypothetical protein [Glutamicibacter mishrai]